MRRIFSLLAINLVALVVLSACNSAEQKATSAGPIAPQTPAKIAPTDGVRRITVTELKDLLARNEAVVIDVRNQESYDQAHIQGAKLMPVADTLKHIDELPKDKLIVTYCS
jgi:predicted sulfurtransferase